MSRNANGENEFSETKDGVSVLKADEAFSLKLKILSEHFIQKYDREPSFVVKVPGRVNLIGEHVDYCGYAVCPMAIKQHVLIAVGISNDHRINVTNVNSDYKDFSCDLDNVRGSIDDSTTGPIWYKYFLCGILGALDVIPKEKVPKGILTAVWGNVPANAGLSSSSALVSASVLSLFHASQYQLSRRDLATISARAERYIGTQGGGMDQAIAFLGKTGAAMLIEFNPLRATAVTLPENAVFVIAHSQAYHNKASTVDFNLRVAECRLAAQIIAKRRNQNWESVKRLIDVQDRLGFSLEEMVSVVMEDLHEEAYTIDEICECLSTTYERLKETSQIAPFNTSQLFKLKQRALHVFQEAHRVSEFQRINNDDTLMEDVKVRLLGELMSKSHVSLCKLYECSHPRVDALVDKAMNCGALGARLTGAGWGGCIVAIILKDNISQFVEKIRKHLLESCTTNGLDLEDLVFPTEPNQGAAIYVL
ncbi:N-acetylgalactosamine kinase [Polistes fuscatus]|uniref:N-acetylgalactosamine kinase n=1 Tax=Polistes fuscatus TaxID=30207 RepID=UPI001CA96A4F|nr:N-acetylgalactosamine kinase [Polistes fuscatus]XP_043495401.1 N-acetylgalactosamine kinase [Polistes fuscatus]XP_043495403.1 N-acetylgalactosamine kinase [Polistes fuscatus]